MGRKSFIVVLGLTVILIIGSVILQRIVFKADQTFGSLFLTPSSFRVVKSQPLDLEVSTTAVEPINVAALELTIVFDPSKLELSETLPSLGWKTVSSSSKNGHLNWLITPSDQGPSLIAVEGDVTFGRIRFSAVGDGATTVNLFQSDTIMASADTAKGNFIYNALTSVQNAAGTISAEANPDASFPEATALVQPIIEDLQAANFVSQKIESSSIVSAPNNALLMLQLAYQGAAQVEFGETTQLGNLVETNAYGAYQAVPISGLTPGQRYYYRVAAKVGQTSRILSPIKSFTTPLAGQGSAKAEPIIFPERAAKTSNVYFSFTNDKGENVIDVQPSVEVILGRATVGKVRRVGGYFQATVTAPDNANKQLIRVKVVSGGQSFESSSLLFDPAYVDPIQPAAPAIQVFAWNQKLILTLLGGLILLFLFSNLFVRLARTN